MASFFVKRASGADNLLLFLVTAAGATLLTRLFLFTFDYPQITRGNIHLAHAVFGGILLSMSNILLFSFHGRRVRQIGAIVGGLGFSQFIDEIGKFITRDNNYFYQPVPVIIYLSFMLLFFVYMYFDKYTPLTAKEIVYEVFESLEDFIENRFQSRRKKTAESLISLVLESPEKYYRPILQGLSQTLSLLPTKPTKERMYVRQLKSSWRWLEDFTAERKPVFYFLLLIFLVYIVNAFRETVSFLSIIFSRHYELFSYEIDSRGDWFLIIAELVSQVVAAIFMARGFVYLVRRRRLRSLQLFRTALAINILITYVFRFYFEQFSASIGLIITLVLFALVQNIWEEEKENS